MDLNGVLLWMVVISCGAVVLRGIRFVRTGGGGWVAVAAAILAAVGGTWLVRRDLAGLVGGALWATFVALPLMAMIATRSYVDRQRFGPAAVIASLVRFLHPMDG